MSKKKLNKTVWYGSDVDLQGNAILPPLAESREDLNGIHEGEIYLHNQDDDPGIWVRTNKGNVKRIGFNKKDFDLSEYLKKQVWDTAWELRTTEEGESYIFCKLPFISQHGVTLYADGGNIDLPSLYAGIPFDNRTIWLNPETKLVEVIGGTGGGSGEGGVSNFWDLTNIPTWITATKPEYSYGEIKETPDLSGYAKLTDVDSRINDLVNGAPQAYDTLKEIADVLQGNVNSIGDIITTLGTKADKTYVDTELAKYIPIAGDTEVTGIKNFLNGLKIGGLPISKYEGHDDVIYIDANVVLRGGLTQYAVDPFTIPSIIESLPQAGYESKGVASFSDKYFVIDTNGKVSIIPDSVGLNEEELTAWLANSDYTTKTYVDDTFATKSSLNATNAEVAKKWTQDDDKIANWDTAYSWGNHASAGYALSTEVAVELAKYLPLSGGKMSGDIVLPNRTYIRFAITSSSNPVAILGFDGTKYLVSATNYATTIRSNGTLKHNSATIWDSNTLTSLSQLTNDTDFTTNAYVNETFVTLKGDPQTIEGEKDFIGGLKVNGSPIVYDSEKGYWLLQGNLLITGGLTQYVDDGSVDLPNLYDGLPIDGTTIYWEETANGKVLKAKVAEGGITSITKDMVVEALGYTPYDASNPNGYITSAALNGYATQTWVNQQGFLTEHQSLDGYVNEIATTGTGNAVTSVSKSGKKLTFTKGATYLTTTVANGLYHPLTTFATVATSGSYNDLSNKPTIPTIPTSLKNPHALSWSGYSSGSYDGSAAKSITIPSNTNQLTNGAGFITSSVSGSISLNGDWENDFGINFNEGGDAKYGFSLLYGASDLFKLVTRANSTTNTTIFSVTRGSSVLNFANTPTVNGSSVWHSGNFTPSNYLPLSGGTLSGDILVPLNPAQSANKASYSITFVDKYLHTRNGELMFGNGSVGYHSIWHSGNSNLSSVDWNASKLILNTTNTTDWNVAIRSSTIQLLRTGNTAGNGPHTYSSGISIMTSYTGFQLASYGGDWNDLYFRSIQDNGTWLPWRTVAFLDSNVASATKLQTARKIWGQDFDGTGNVDGLIKITGIGGAGISQFKGSNYVFALGSGSSATGAGTEYGMLQLFQNGSELIRLYAHGDGVSWINAGNVGIGTTSPFSKLHVAGAATIGIESSTTPYSSINFRNTDTDLWQISARFNKNVSANNNVMNFYYNNGSTWKVTMALYTTGNLLVAGGITQYSDIRKKTKLNDVELTLKQVANAPLIEHYYNSDDKKTTHVGSIAQYWAEMNDWFCKLDSDGYYTMEIQNAALASAISVARELERYESKTDKKIRLLKKRINELEDEIEKLKK